MSKPLAAVGGTFLLTLAVLATGGAAPPSASASASAADAAPFSAPFSAPSGTSAETTVVTLTTGERIAVAGSGGHTTYTLLSHSPKSTVQFLRGANGDEYAIPSSAERLLGRGYNVAQFDVSALVRGGAAAPTGVTPFYPLHPVQVSVTDDTGAPAADPFVMLVNIDSVSRQNNLVPVADGVGRIQLPAGHYVAISYANDYDAAGNVTALRQVVVSDYVVPSSGAAPVLSVDFRTATSPVSARTPRPSVMDGVGVTVAVADPSGAASAGGAAAGAGVPVYVNAAPAPPVGRMHYVVQWDAAAARASDRYRYDVAFPADNGIPADETFTVRANQLATVRQNLDTDPAAPASAGSPAAFANGPLDPILVAANAVFSVAAAPPMPGTLTQYLGTADGGAWSQEDVTPNGVGLYDGERVFSAGRSYRVDWAHGPLAPDWGQYTGPQQECDVCASGSDLSVVFNLLADSAPSHQFATMPRPAALHLTVYRDDAVVFDNDFYYGALLTGIPLAPSTYRAVMDMDLSGVAGFSQSTTTHTDATFKYDPATDPDSTLPSGDHCIQPDPSTPCQILPVLTLHYGLATGPTGTSSAPVQTMALGVGHLGYDGHGSRSPITSASVSVSFDGGRTWRPAHVTGHAGRYQAAWPNSAPKGTAPMLKVSAADARGDAITQTITNAYVIGGTK
jgi:hypothetical protein